MLSESSKYATLVPVRDMDRAVKFYTETLGGKLLSRADREMKDFWASVRVSKAEFWLIAPPEKEKRELAYSAFLVKDIEAAVKDLKDKGVKFQRAEKNESTTKVAGPISYDPVGATAFFKDSEGNLLMLFKAT
ncbi:MAG: VOC family protein [Nitrososphaerales archaeon]|jgi:catechol 2,3-dioxygenase-like lactoylglutathione lyase family enzyme